MTVMVMCAVVTWVAKGVAMCIDVYAGVCLWLMCVVECDGGDVWW